jgi:hypothetical protein
MEKIIIDNVDYTNKLDNLPDGCIIKGLKKNNIAVCGKIVGGLLWVDELSYHPETLKEVRLLNIVDENWDSTHICGYLAAEMEEDLGFWNFKPERDYYDNREYDEFGNEEEMSEDEYIEMQEEIERLGGEEPGEWSNHNSGCVDVENTIGLKWCNEPVMAWMKKEELEP